MPEEELIKHNILSIKFRGAQGIRLLSHETDSAKYTGTNKKEIKPFLYYKATIK